MEPALVRAFMNSEFRKLLGLTLIQTNVEGSRVALPPRATRGRPGLD